MVSLLLTTVESLTTVDIHAVCTASKVSVCLSVCLRLFACTGDLMSPPNLDNLLVVPFGCGEQNLVKTTNNFVVANYLDSTKQLTGAIAARVRANIMKGEERGRAMRWGCSRHSCKCMYTLGVHRY